MSAKGTHLTDEQKARISAARKAVGNEKLKGRTRPPEVVQKVSAALAGRKRPDTSARMKGVPKSQETRRRLSESLRNSEAHRAAMDARQRPRRDGDKKQASELTHQRVRKGIWPHPSTLPCTDCGQIWSPGLSRHEYDHYLGYAPEHHESVQVVCSKCHHAREKARGRVRQQEKPFSRCVVCDKELTHRRGGRCATCYRARLT